MSHNTNRESAIFETARQLHTPAERTAYLDRACAGDSNLRERVEAFLQHHPPVEAGPDAPSRIEPEPPAIRPADSIAAESGSPWQRHVPGPLVVAVIGGLLAALAMILVMRATVRTEPLAPARNTALAQPENEPPQTNPVPVAASFRELVRLGNTYGRNGEWRNAFDCFRQVITAGGTGDWREWEWAWATASALVVGETDTCQAWCRKLIEHYGTVEDPQLAERCAKLCLAPPGVSGDLLEQAGAWADFAAATGPGNPWGQLVKGQAEYRRGNWADALRWLRQPERSRQFDIALQAGGFAAMARHQLGDAAGARRGLEELSQRVKLVERTGDLNGDSWDTCARAFALRVEVERLILGRQVSPPLDPTTLLEQRAKWRAVAQLVDTAEQFAKQESWAEARDAYAQVLAHPDFAWDPWQVRPSLVAQQMAAAFLLAGDDTRHRDLCRALLDRPQEYLPLVTRERSAWIYLIKMDHFPPDLKARALAVVQQTCQNAEAENSAWVRLVCGLAAYREGHHADALAAFDQAQFGGDVTATARLLVCRAMACQGAGQTNEAAAALLEAEAAFAQRTPENSGWWNNGFYQIALKELRSVPATPSGPPASL